MTSRHAIFIKTFEGDIFNWLPWCLKFLEKNWRSESELVIAAPNFFREEIEGMVPGRFKKSYIFIPMEHEMDGYLEQQYAKMTADLYCEGDLITFFDSDVMLIKPTAVEDLMEEGKPVIWYRSYDELGDAVPWRPIVEMVMGRTPANEYMSRHPFTFWTDTIIDCRYHLEMQHDTPLYNVIKERPNREFSEFNVLGFYASLYDAEQYVFKHVSEQTGDPRVRQFHSWTEWHESTQEELKRLYEHSSD